MAGQSALSLLQSQIQQTESEIAALKDLQEFAEASNASEAMKGYPQNVAASKRRAQSAGASTRSQQKSNGSQLTSLDLPVPPQIQRMSNRRVDPKWKKNREGVDPIAFSRELLRKSLHSPLPPLEPLWEPLSVLENAENGIAGDPMEDSITSLSHDPLRFHLYSRIDAVYG
eukprot:gnl/MRDRNA2_/MRDRNA2_88626_c0_seq1.p1 gnl/MRDRNA2_/MRDRNA2_88626_c0~~gnl/MRDRNA2_/MRDRNA2_88626_c0_seq1.p1  ORF type:complete len:199 (-),score=30.66 gnl/MRDRNA2_/MRDRNA2_88626_c0_seq1:348-860(-)